MARDSHHGSKLGFGMMWWRQYGRDWEKSSLLSDSPPNQKQEKCRDGVGDVFGVEGHVHMLL